ncbi:hypothetical protein AB0393_34740 [Streptomyces cyaneofuscatus]|uniref:hypothetical protein n=1 Tax=Streptomyces cyaneofuscatus TaxID=66883 RepID=UPI00344EAC6F
MTPARTPGVVITRYTTQAGATVTQYRDAEGRPASDCTACGEYAWPAYPSEQEIRAHAKACTRPPRTAA